MKNIYLDYDEVLVNLMDPWLDWINHNFKKDLKLTDVLDYSFLRRNLGPSVNQFWNNDQVYDIWIDPLQGAVEFIEALKAKGYKITIISFCTQINFESKRRHAVKHFGIHDFIGDGDKCQHTCDGLLIEDNAGNLIGHVMNNKMPGLLFNFNNTRPWANVSSENSGSHLPIKYAPLIKTVHTYEALLNGIEEMYDVRLPKPKRSTDTSYVASGTSWTTISESQ